MNDLAEMAQRVLAELEEFWEENVFAMLNTILDPKGEAQELQLLQGALRELVEREYIVMGYQSFYPRNPEKLAKQASLRMISDLETWFKFDQAKLSWTLGKGDFRKERYPAIYSTASGRQKAVEILTQRGYQWWRPKR